ncbi:glycosyltransferase family 92-domain-containing protein [Entophlyctis helioformis]|nr:glycosyltransferase family 92-domain-containing protein [Entophlyctis helioformis]
MMRNKAEYVQEWLEFHLLQGFDKFVIYNHMSTDGLAAVLGPYIRADLVELVDWPLDYAKLASPPFGPRLWTSDERRQAFETVFRDECLHVTDKWHMHGGCQRSAMLDGIARYRNRTEWLSIFDVDEFFFVPLKDGQTVKRLGEIRTVRDVLLDASDAYDHIKVPGRIFGTSGYMDTPPRPSPSLPSRLVTESYRFRRNHSDDRFYERFMLSTTYTEKSFAKAALVSGTVIHHFTFDDLPPEQQSQIRTHQRQDALLTMNHYQFLSHFGQSRKAKTNTNWGIDYWRPQDILFCELPDYSVGYLVPLVLDNMVRRRRAELARVEMERRAAGTALAAGNSDGGRQPLMLRKPMSKPAKTAASVYTKPRRTGFTQICVAFTHLDGEAHHLRRSVYSMLEYFKTVEPDIAFETVLVTPHKPAPGDAARPEIEYLSDLLPLLDHVQVMPANTPWPLVLDTATSLCSHAPYILYMEDMWEARFPTSLSLADYNRPGLANHRLLADAMDLLRHEPRVLEVWVGDTPSLPREYADTAGPWTTADYLQPVDRVASNRFWLERRLAEGGLIGGVLWEQLLNRYIHEQKVLREHGRLVLMEHGSNAVRGGGGSGGSGSGGGESGGQDQSGAAHLLLQAVGNTSNETAAETADDEKLYGTGEIASATRHGVERHTRLIHQLLGCTPTGQDCPSTRPWYRTHAATHTSAIGAFRLGGSLKHTAKLTRLNASWMRLAEMLETLDMAVLDEAMGRCAEAAGLVSAQFCLGDPALDRECRLDPDWAMDDATTGIMWRQRLILREDDDKILLHDRP